MRGLTGCDISHWETVADWGAVETEFCITKASQGTEFVDPKFAEYWKGMKRVALRRGSFHFLEAQTESQGAVEARHYLHVLDTVGGLKPGDLTYCCDMESGSTPAGAVGFIAEVKRLKPGATVILYCSFSVIPQRTFWEFLKRKAKWCGGDFLWVARYGPATGPGLLRWHIWQWTDEKGQGVEPHETVGIGRCDQDVVHGGQAKLERMTVE